MLFENGLRLVKNVYGKLQGNDSHQKNGYVKRKDKINHKFFNKARETTKELLCKRDIREVTISQDGLGFG